MPGNGGVRVSASPATRVVVTPPPAHYLHELPAQDEERLARLFQRLDLDGNGRIDVHDLSQALREVGVHSQYAHYAQVRSLRARAHVYTCMLLHFAPALRTIYCIRFLNISLTSCHASHLQNFWPGQIAPKVAISVWPSSYIMFANMKKICDYNFLTLIKIEMVSKIDLEELIRAFKDLGIEIAREEATQLLQR
ncbi:hypothetical protein DMN91_003087 [Ooceraea biroi]|uniref:EF-hand domain-containing protein n=1 Tax=Ooceraea biroi TaxID=2015173 RepID=A0A3L8DY10_OOCBI|nr:hypothetical protein DMN91_003087 [Ooceraea biroi]